MNVEYINSFYKAIRDVMKRMVNSDIEMGKVELSKSLNKDDVTGILINVIGDLDGYVLFKFPNDTALSIVNTMSGLDMNQIDEFVYSALSELVNIISGNAITNISELGKICDISTPEIFLESLNDIIEEDKLPIRVPIKIEENIFYMNIFIKD